MAQPERVVVVGASIGGVRAAQALRRDGFSGELVVVGAEDLAPYDKPPLSKQVLAGEHTVEDIALLGSGGWAGEGIEARLGSPAAALDRARREITLEDGDRLHYDAVVLATGARARTLAGGEPLVHTNRELRDTLSLQQRLRQGGPVVVVGSGFIGAEIASTATQLGLETTLVEAAPQPFSGALGPGVGGLVEELHRQAGVTVLSGAGVARIERLPDDTGVVHLTDGRRVPAASVVLGIGVIPNTEWLVGSGIALDNGITTDQHCRVAGADDVWALGDVASWWDVRTGRHRRVEHWTNAVEQASLVAHNVMHPDDQRVHSSAPYFWSDQHGMKIQMAGRVRFGDQVEVLRFTTASGERTVALYSADGEFSAAVVFGWPRAVVPCRRAWERSSHVDEVRSALEAISTGVTPLMTK